MKDQDIEKLLTVILASAVSGVVIGSLLSLKSKPSKSQKIAKEGDKYISEITKLIDEIRQFLDRKSKTAKADYKATKDDLDELGKDARGKGQDLVRRAKRLLSYD